MDYQYYKKLIYSSYENMRTHSFSQFVQKVHQLLECKKAGCYIGNFVGCLKDVLLDPKRSYDDQKNFFILHCINFSKAFKCPISENTKSIR